MKLKPCPFCGSEPRLYFNVSRDRDGCVVGKTCAVVCDKCGGQLNTFVQEDFFECNPDEQIQLKTINAWNTRTKTEGDKSGN